MSAVESRENRDWGDGADQLDKSEIRRITATGWRLAERGSAPSKTSQPFASYIRMWTTAPLLSKQSRPAELSLALKRLVLSAYLGKAIQSAMRVRPSFRLAYESVPSGPPSDSVLCRAERWSMEDADRGSGWCIGWLM